MKRFLCVGMVLMVLLSACSAPVQPPSVTVKMGNQEYGMYELNFSVSCISGRYEDWEFVYTYGGERVQSGYQFSFPLGIVSFQSVQVDVREKDCFFSSYKTTFPVAVYDGGSGNAEIAVTGIDGNTAVFKITCRVTRVDQP